MSKTPSSAEIISLYFSNKFTVQVSRFDLKLTSAPLSSTATDVPSVAKPTPGLSIITFVICPPEIIGTNFAYFPSPFTVKVGGEL